MTGTRTTKVRPVLAELTTNGPTVPKKRGRKQKVQPTSYHAADDEQQSGPSQAHLRNASTNYNPIDDSDEAERQWTRGSPSIRLRRAFAIFKDGPEEQIGPIQRQHSQSHLSNPFITQPRPVGIKPRNTLLANQSVVSTHWRDQLRAHARLSIDPEDTEIAQPSGETEGTHTKSPPLRVTQRYFSVTGKEEPQLFDNMPPQMDFGGSAGPKYRGATLNPLNPFFRQPRFRPPLSQASTPDAALPAKVTSLAGPLPS